MACHTHIPTLNFRSIVHFLLETFSSESYEIFPVQTTHILGSNPRNIRKALLPVRPKTKKEKKQIMTTVKVFALNADAILYPAAKRSQHCRTQH